MSTETIDVQFQGRDFLWHKYTLNPSQTEAYNAFTQGFKFVGHGGGVRSGKSFLGMLLAYKWSMEMPGNVGIIVRNTYKEIEGILFYELLRKFFLDKFLTPKQWRYRTKTYTVEFDNGSMIIFQALRSSRGEAIDISKALMGRGLGWFVIDQAEMCSESHFNTLIHRLSLNTVPKRQGFVNFNPRGHDWCHKVFVDQGTKRPDCYFVQAKTEDNVTNLPSDYLHTVKNTMHKEWVSRWIDGSFENWDGLIYPMYSTPLHVVPPLNDLPKDQKLYLSIDPGLNNPTAVGFYTILQGGYVLKFDEYYQRGKLVKEWFREVKRMCERWGKEKIDGYCIIDPYSIKRSPDTGKSILDTLRELNQEHDFNLYPYPGDTDLFSGLDRVASYLVPDPSLMNPFTQKLGSPRLFITHTCQKTLWELGQYKWSRSPDLDVDPERPDFNNLPEKPLDRNNHAMDEMRHFLMRMPPATRQVSVKDYIRLKEYQPLYKATGY